MNNPVRVKILKCINNLHSIALHLQLMKPLPPLEKFVHALIMTELQQDIDVVAIFEEMHKLSNVGMLHRSMNLDFTHQLLLGPAPLQRRFLNDLGRSDCLGLALNKFVAFGETTFSQEFSFHVLSIADFSILVFDPLLDDLSGSILLWLLCSDQVGLTAAVLRRCCHGLGTRDTTTSAWSCRLSSYLKRSLTIVI